MTSHGSSSALAARGHLGKVVCDSLSTVGRDWHTPSRVPPSVRIGNSLVFPVAAPTASHIVTESAGLRHDPLEEGSERGEAGVALTDRDRIRGGPHARLHDLHPAHARLGGPAHGLPRRPADAAQGRPERPVRLPGPQDAGRPERSGTMPMRSPGGASSGPGSGPASPAWPSTGSPPSTRSPMRWHAPRSCWSASPWAWCSASGTSTT